MAAFTCAHRTYGFPFLPQAVGTPWIHDFAQKRLAPGDVVHVILSGTRLALHAKYIASVFYLSPSRLHVSAIFESRAAIFHSHTPANVGWLSILFCGLLLLSPYHSMCLNFGFPNLCKTMSAGQSFPKLILWNTECNSCEDSLEPRHLKDR